MQQGGSERARRYCTNCGAQASPDGAFCASCGARLPSGSVDEAPTREITRPVQEPSGNHGAPPTFRFPGAGRDALLGLLLALACAGLSVAAIYAALAARGVFSDPSIPGTIGLALFALLHGGGASVDVPPIPALLGIGGSVRLGLPVTSFALLPFLLSLLAGRLLGRHTRTAALFAVAAALAYALLLALLAVLGAASSETGDVAIRFAPDPLSAALRGLLLVGLGTAIGAAASRGPLLPAWARQVLRGALWAVGVSLAVTLVLTVIVALAQGSGAQEPAQRAPQVLPQPSLGGGSIGEVLGAIGAFFALLPVALGNLWLLAHGVPVGFQNAPDLSGVPLVGRALSDVPLRVALLGDWPWGGAWRLLLLGPLLGLLIGGFVAARGAPPGTRWQQGALVALPYAAIALLAAVLVGASADLTLAGAANLEVAFRASLAWLMLILPVGAVLGALGGLLSGGDAFPAPRPSRAFVAASLVSGALVLASLPVFLADPSSGAAQPVGPLTSGGQPAPDGSPGPSATPDPSGATPPPEETPPPEPTVASVPPEGVDSEADPAFDPLLPTLRQTTTAPIMLPADLPEELGNVAVDADRDGDGYGVLSLYRPTGNMVEGYVHANDAGTLVADPGPPYEASDLFEATKEESVELPDGTGADLRYMEPKEGVVVNQGPFWEGSFEREGHHYVLRVPLDDPSGDIARRALSSMVEVPDSSGYETEDPVAEAEAAAGEYYRAAGVGDWAYTYENLDSETQALFTEEEWFAKNQWFADNGSVIYNIESAESVGTDGEPVVEVTLTLTYGDGTSSTRTTYFVYEGGTWQHRFGQEEYDLFMPELTFEEFVAAQQ